MNSNGRENRQFWGGCHLEPTVDLTSGDHLCYGGAKEGGIVFCYKCGAELRQDARFCDRCGTQAIGATPASPSPGTTASDSLGGLGTQVSSPTQASFSRVLLSLPRTDLIVGAATLLLLVFLFLPWYSYAAVVTLSAVSAGGFRVLILLLSLLMVVYLGLENFKVGGLGLRIRHGQVLFVVAFINLVLALLAFLIAPASGLIPGYGVLTGWSRGGYGAILALLAAVGAVVGAYLAWTTESPAVVSDLRSAVRRMTTRPITSSAPPPSSGVSPPPAPAAASAASTRADDRAQPAPVEPKVEWLPGWVGPGGPTVVLLGAVIALVGWWRWVPLPSSVASAISSGFSTLLNQYQAGLNQFLNPGAAPPAGSAPAAVALGFGTQPGQIALVVGLALIALAVVTASTGGLWRPTLLPALMVIGSGALLADGLQTLSSTKTALDILNLYLQPARQAATAIGVQTPFPMDYVLNAVAPGAATLAGGAIALLASLVVLLKSLRVKQAVGAAVGSSLSTSLGGALEPGGSGSTVVCASCHAINPAVNRFCRSCGAGLRQSVPDLACRQCGQKNSASTRFCIACGASLESSGASSAAGGSGAPVSARAAGAEHPLGESAVAVVAEQDSWSCTHCGARNPGPNRFCEACGVAFKS